MSCPACFSGHVHNGQPKGRVETIHGLPTYVSSPAEGTHVKGIIIIVTDAFGWEFVNSRILADHYSDGGDYLVYIPDFMAGRAAPPSLMETLPRLMKTATIWDWVWKPYYAVQGIANFLPFVYFNRPAVAWPRIRSFFGAVRQHEGADLGVGAAGFCWGGKHAVNLAHADSVVDGSPLVDASFTGHPSFVQVPGELERVSQPLSIAIGDRDFVMPMAQVEQAKRIFGAKADVETEVTVYPGAGHGFCVRGDLDNADQERDARAAEEQALQWFKRHLDRRA